MKNIINTELQPRGGIKPSSNATFPDFIKRFFESIQKKCCELSLVNSESTSNKQANDNKVDSPLSWIIASLGQVAHFTSVVIRNVLATSGWVRFAHTAPYAKSAHNSLVKAIAFTLAETLVVMGIIGVVAALTIPNLNQSTGNREKVAKLKKVYSNLEDAFGRATAVYGPFEEWFLKDSDEKTRSTRLADRMTEFMKISKNCGYDGAGCFSSSYKYLNGDVDVSPNAFDKNLKFLLADGTALNFYAEATKGTIYVDIDGLKGSNIRGKDYFLFNVYNTGVMPNGRNISNAKLKKDCFTSGRHCEAWIIDVGNMDYLKANKGTCPNGTELTWENTSCK